MVKSFSNYGEVFSSNNDKSTSNKGMFYQIPDNFLVKIVQRERMEEKTKSSSKMKHFGK